MTVLRIVFGTILAVCAWPPAAFAQAPVTIEYYHVDALGSVRAVTDASGSVLRTQHYHPFGEGVGVAPNGDPMGFTGKPRDAETGLDYFGARYYAQRTGRFSTVDPVMSISAGLLEPQRWNRYAYAGNNPTRFVDPDGREFVISRPPGTERFFEIASSVRSAVNSWISGGESGGSARHAASAVADIALGTFLPQNNQELAASITPMAGVAASKGSQVHHIATNKSIVTGWTAQFSAIFAKAGLSLEDAANRMGLIGHSGRHSQHYHQYVLNSLQSAVAGLKGDQYTSALMQALERLRKELESNPNLIRGPK